MIIDAKIKNLVLDIENNTGDVTAKIKELISALHKKLSKDDVIQRYQSYSKNIGEIYEYPTDSDGFAKSFDLFEDEDAFWDTWSKYGIVVGKKVVSGVLCNDAVARMHDIVLDMSDGKCDLKDPSTWDSIPKDADDTSFISRGFFELYHDAVLADIRQSIRLYIHHVLIWGRVDLWTSFDRLGVKLPHHEESKALPLHVDQNPLIHPQFKTLQGVLALVDCPIERGTFVGVPGSRCLFDKYSEFAPERGEFVELDITTGIASQLKEHAQAFPLKAGDIVSWDSRTTHANSENVSGDTRYVAYVAAGPAREEDNSLINVRMEGFKSGEGSNVREALMHASKKSRYSDLEKLQSLREPEELNLLGQLLYGQEKYEKYIN